PAAGLPEGRDRAPRSCCRSSPRSRRAQMFVSSRTPEVAAHLIQRHQKSTPKPALQVTRSTSLRNLTFRSVRKKPRSVKYALNPAAAYAETVTIVSVRVSAGIEI